jgi:hypothetical protein
MIRFLIRAIRKIRIQKLFLFWLQLVCVGCVAATLESCLKHKQGMCHGGEPLRAKCRRDSTA